MDYLMLIIEETQRLGDEWKKCMKRYGMQDERTQASYNRYMGADKLRTACMELAENKQEAGNEYLD